MLEIELRKQGMGLEFYNLDSAMQKKIVEFVDRNLPSGCIV